MENRAAAHAEKIIYGVSIDVIPLLKLGNGRTMTLKTLNKMTTADLIGQTHTEALTPTRKEDNSRVVDSRILTAIIIGCLVGVALWVGIILLFL